MGVLKTVHDPAHKGHTKDVAVPIFSYFPNDGLAQLIVEAWANPGNLLKRDSDGYPTTAALQEATDKINSMGGFALKSAVVITEEEHDNDYTIKLDSEEVVFVLPSATRRVATANEFTLLNTAKLLMACTPNGI